MARGTVIGEPVVSQANTKAYAESYERMFGKDHKPQRGRWSFGEADKTEKALHAPIMAGRFYEGSFAPGSNEDIGSRKKHRAYMKRNGLAPASDYSPTWYEKKRAGDKREQNKRRHETLERISYEKWKP